MSTATKTPWRHLNVQLTVARKEAGLSQQELAEKVGVQQAIVSRWETGKSEPKVSQLRKIVDATDAQWLCDLDFDPSPCIAA